MATNFYSLGPPNTGPIAFASAPRLPQFASPGTITTIFRPIFPLPAAIFSGGSAAMSLAPLVLPFLALLSWWFK